MEPAAERPTDAVEQQPVVEPTLPTRYTVRFTLTFDFDQVKAAEERWQRLSVYAETFANYAERYASAS